jgi:hypothetical protein
MTSLPQEVSALFQSHQDVAVTDLSWLPAQSYALQLDSRRESWHAGHVSALLSDGTCVIAGTQTGGVWLLNPSIQPAYGSGHRATPLSNDWETPDISALAYVPDGRTQVYVGTANSDLLFFLELKQGLGEMTLDRVTRIPLPSALTVFAIAIAQGQEPAVHSRPRIVLACSNGVLWADLPNSLGDTKGYVWQSAQGLPPGPISGLAPAGWSGKGRYELSSQNVAAAVYGGPIGGGLYLGSWESGKLVFSAGTIQGVIAASMRRTSLASCTDHPERIYAVSAAGDGTLLAVLGSVDGGVNWTVLGSPSVWTFAGIAGDWNQCIAASHNNPNVVAVGWQAGGPYFSVDGGRTWQHPRTDDAKGGVPGDANLHGDLHALFFGQDTLHQNVLYVGGDGGIARTMDLGLTYDSQFSRPLNNLQIYGIQDTEQSGATYGTLPGPGGCLTASSSLPGLLACGTQDNGNMFLAPRQQDGLAWQPVGTPLSDGGLCLLVDGLAGLLQQSNVSPQVSVGFWDDSSQRFSSFTTVPVDGNAAGISVTGMASVGEPPLTVLGFMFACAGDASGNVYSFNSLPGLFGVTCSLHKIANVGSEVVGISCLDGQNIVVGTVDGRLLQIDRDTGSVSAEGFSPALSDPSQIISRVEIFRPQYDLHTLSRGDHVEIYVLRGGTILHLARNTWRALPGTQWLAFAVDPESGRLFGADQATVYELDGTTWNLTGTGLPTFAHCTDLRIATNSRGGRDLFLATYGRSVWRATISLGSPHQTNPKVPQLVGEVLFGVIQDGGGIVRIGDQFVRIPPRPLAKDLLAGLALYSLAQEGKKDKAIQRVLLEQIVERAKRELELGDTQSSPAKVTNQRSGQQ